MSNLFKRTKTLATIGPATDSEEMIDQLIAAGLDNCRLNFSHGTYDKMDEFIGWIRKAADKYGRHVAIVQDLQGPKIRLGQIKDNYLDINEGDDIILDYALKEHDGGLTLPVQYNLAAKVKVGDPVYIFDGKIRTHVQEILSDTAIRLTAENKGFVNSNKGLNLPDTDFGGDIFPEKDIRDLDWGVSRDFDYVALSFIQKAEDICTFRRMLDERGSQAKIIAKIETKNAVMNDEHLEEIVKAADAIMVARGDMGYEVGAEIVPIIQRKLIRMCREHAKVCIVATQTMSTMVDNPMPTRAEVSDVANAVIQGADVVMTSEETAMGKYPLETIKEICNVINYVQDHAEITPIPQDPQSGTPDYDAIAEAAAKIAAHVEADAIICQTASGRTARAMSAQRPALPIYSVTPNERVANQLSLFYGNRAYVREFSPEFGFDLAKELVENGTLTPRSGRKHVEVVIVSGDRDVAGTDTIRLRRISI